VAAWVWFGQAVGSGATLAVRRPWTGALAARRYEPEVRRHPWFTQANELITGGWTLYFVVAGLVTALTASWVGLVLVAPTPLLAVASFKIGDGYARWRTGRTSAPEGTM